MGSTLRFARGQNFLHPNRMCGTCRWPKGPLKQLTIPHPDQSLSLLSLLNRFAFFLACSLLFLLLATRKVGQVGFVTLTAAKSGVPFLRLLSKVPSSILPRSLPQDLSAPVIGQVCQFTSVQKVLNQSENAPQLLCPCLHPSIKSRVSHQLDQPGPRAPGHVQPFCVCR